MEYWIWRFSFEETCKIRKKCLSFSYFFGNCWFLIARNFLRKIFQNICMNTFEKKCEEEFTKWVYEVIWKKVWGRFSKTYVWTRLKKSVRNIFQNECMKSFEKKCEEDFSKSRMFLTWKWCETKWRKSLLFCHS